MPNSPKPLCSTWSVKTLIQVALQAAGDLSRMLKQPDDTEQVETMLVLVEDVTPGASGGLAGSPSRLAIANRASFEQRRLLCIKDARIETVQLPQGGTRTMLVLSGVCE